MDSDRGGSESQPVNVILNETAWISLLRSDSGEYSFTEAAWQCDGRPVRSGSSGLCSPFSACLRLRRVRLFLTFLSALPAFCLWLLLFVLLVRSDGERSPFASAGEGVSSLCIDCAGRCLACPDTGADCSMGGALLRARTGYWCVLL